MTISDGKNGGWLWIVNLLLLLFVALLSWNANNLCDDVDTTKRDIQVLKQQSVRWEIVADDVKEMKADLKQLLRIAQ